MRFQFGPLGAGAPFGDPTTGDVDEELAPKVLVMPPLDVERGASGVLPTVGEHDRLRSHPARMQELEDLGRDELRRLRKAGSEATKGREARLLALRVVGPTSRTAVRAGGPGRAGVAPMAEYAGVPVDTSGNPRDVLPRTSRCDESRPSIQDGLVPVLARDRGGDPRPRRPEQGEVVVAQILVLTCGRRLGKALQVGRRRQQLDGRRAGGVRSAHAADERLPARLAVDELERAAIPVPVLRVGRAALDGRPVPSHALPVHAGRREEAFDAPQEQVETKAWSGVGRLRPSEGLAPVADTSQHEQPAERRLGVGRIAEQAPGRDVHGRGSRVARVNA